MKKRALKWGLSLLGAGALVLLILVRHSFYGSHESVAFRVEKGDSAKAVAQKLYQSGVIDSPAGFLFLSRITGASRRLHRGPYLLQKNRYWRIMRQLSRGETHKIKTVIPEGWSGYQTAERLESEGVLRGKNAFLKKVKDLKLDGKLFPSTYFFEPDSEPETVLSAFLERFNKVFSPGMRRRAEEMRMKEGEVLALASIIEREAKNEGERPLISSVYHNRLKRGMALEADPTVQYAIGQGKFWKDRLYYKDLKVNSPYNTYRVRGLPPGPICNPGLPSIQAALNPAQTPYLYFVADGTGGHQFFQDHRSHTEWQKANRRRRIDKAGKS